MMTWSSVAEIAQIARDRGILVHTDAVQSFGKLPLSVGVLGVDFLSFSGHKLYAPKGIGALYIRSGININPIIHGAGHEHGMRPGTENARASIREEPAIRRIVKVCHRPCR